MYAIYILLMYFNRGLEAYFTAKVAGLRRHKKSVTREDWDEESQPLVKGGPYLTESMKYGDAKYGEAESSFGGGSRTESEEGNVQCTLSTISLLKLSELYSTI
jgi:hypothetical protein